MPIHLMAGHVDRVTGGTVVDILGIGISGCEGGGGEDILLLHNGVIHLVQDKCHLRL